MQVPAEHRMTARGAVVALCGAMLLVGFSERSRMSDPNFSWLVDINIDTTPYAFWLLVLPLFWLVRQPLIVRPPRCVSQFKVWLEEGASTDFKGSIRRPFGGLVAAMLVAGVAYLSCLHVASSQLPNGLLFGDLPPAFHDEFSYLLQAETMQAGRWSFPSHPTAARMFDQMHVLNEGQLASRYFPGTGAWLALFMTSGSPYLAQWVATALTAAFVFAIGRELASNRVGLIAGLLTAVAPGIDLFGNLLLAHQPTLVGLSFFFWNALKLLRQLADPVDESPRGEFVSVFMQAFLAGIGLAFGMLCRPMTAAGIGLPFGMWLAVWLTCNRQRQRRAATCVTVGFAVPLLIAFGVLAWQNVRITGHITKSPYSLYTELFTPSHQYGFNNVIRAESQLSPRVLDHYDRWAENLTPQLAVRNVGLRLLSSWIWTLGPVVIVASVILVLSRRVYGRDESGWRREWCVLASIASLHVVHVPYWFVGIMHWHYVFESAPLWCLIVGLGSERLLKLFRALDRPLMPLWWGGVVTTGVLVNQVAIDPLWSMSRVEVGVQEVAFSRLKQHEFRRILSTLPPGESQLVFVRHDPADRHIDYVSNHPSLSGPLLLARLPADALTTEEETLRLAAAAFPDRAMYVFDARTQRVQRVRSQGR